MASFGIRACFRSGLLRAGMYWTLVATGAHRGHIWNVTDAGAQPSGRSFGYTTATDGFAGWATHWAAGKEWFDIPY